LGQTHIVRFSFFPKCKKVENIHVKKTSDETPFFARRRHVT